MIYTQFMAALFIYFVAPLINLLELCHEHLFPKSSGNNDRKIV